MKKDDIVEFRVDKDTIKKGRVIWIKEGNVGLIINDHLKPHQREAIVMPIKDCTIVQEKLAKLTDEELIASIERLKGMRFPRKMATRVRKAPDGRKTELTKTMEALDKIGLKNDEDINVLIQKALKGDV